MVDDGRKAKAVFPAFGKVGNVNVLVVFGDLSAPVQQRVLGRFRVALQLDFLNLRAGAGARWHGSTDLSAQHNGAR